MPQTSNIRVRFAPSPTGFQHIGGLRTSLYNYLFAKKNNGVFILRIEDTDQKRFVAGALENTIEFHETFDLQYDEGPFLKDGKIQEEGDKGPYIQSKRLDLYIKYAETLIHSGNAYRCFCNEERLTKLRKEQASQKIAPRYDGQCRSLSPEVGKQKKENGEMYVIRFRMPHGREVVCHDLIHGDITFDTDTLEDFVLIKSDGFPTYHLANVVDDHLMEISHVLRAVEWLPSLPKHILLYESFTWTQPQFAHLPTILGSDGRKKLSKRDGDVSIDSFLQKGYLTEALINFVALLGWHPGQGKTQEIFTLEELISAFDLAQVHKAGAVFDLKKLDWMNAEYIKRLSSEELYKRALPFLEEKEFFKEWNSQQLTVNEEIKTGFIKRLLLIEQDRLVKLSDVGENNLFFFAEDSIYDKALLNWKQNTADMTRDALTKAEATLASLDDADWEKREALEAVLMEAAGDKRGDFLWPLRVALTGAERSPSPFDVAWVLGKDESLKRIHNALLSLS